jgi:hypothetical protein
MMKKTETLKPTSVEEASATANVCVFVPQSRQTDEKRQNHGPTTAPKQNDEDDPGPAAA